MSFRVHAHENSWSSQMTSLRRVALKALTAVLSLSGFMACTTSARDVNLARLVERSHMTMGSELRVMIWTADEAGATFASDAVFREFDRLEALMTVWRDDSDIARLNRAAGEHPVQISPEVREVLRVARQVSEWTG